MLTRAEILTFRSLGDKHARQTEGVFIAEGEKLVGEIVRSEFTVKHLFSTAENSGAEHITAKEMERISQLKTPTDTLAVVEIPHYVFQPETVQTNLVLALDGVQNPGNLGTIIRLADWFGISDIICSENSADCFNPKVVQATMGAITRVRVHYTNLVETLSQTARYAPVYGTLLAGENLYKTNITQNGVIVMGSEGTGLTEAVEKCLTKRLFIPPFPESRRTTESLNVAIATGILCAEFRRR